MESMIIRGSNASGIYIAGPQRYFNVESVMFDVPISATNDATVTLSGAQTGAKTFNSTTIVNIPFKANEDVYITSSGFLSTYQVVINYTQVGDASSYVQTDISRVSGGGYSVPWRFQ
jgi:hypothetical protein